MATARPGLDSLRRRPAAFFGLAVLVAAAVAISAVSPMLLRTALEASLGRAAPAGSLAVVLKQRSGVDAGLQDPAEALPSAGLWRVHPPSVVGAQRGTWQPTTGGRSFDGRLTASPGCRTVTVVRGACPSEDDEVVVPDVGVPVGARITVQGTVLRVVGVYRRATDGGPFTEAGASAAERAEGTRAAGADLVFSRTGLAALQPGRVTTWAVTLTRPLRLDDVAAARRAIGRTNRLLTYDISTTVETPLIDAVDAQDGVARAGSLLALTFLIQALAVAWAAEAVFVAAVARSRAGEWGVARLRGFGLPRRLLIVFAEPLLAVAAGAVVGYLAAVLAATLAAGPAARVQPVETLPVLAALAAVAGCMVALVLATVRSASIPLDRLLRQRVDPARLGRVAVAAQVGVLVATALVVASALLGGSLAGGGLPLLAPALVAVSVGLIGLRIAVVLLRGRGTALPRTAFGLVVIRRLARSPSLLAPAVVVCAATAVAVSALQTASVGDRTDRALAAASVGADRVLTVESADRAGLLAAVRRADPSGSKAMAVELAGAGPDLVAVDSARLGAVAAWQASWSGRTAAQLHRALDPSTPEAVRLTGSRVTLGLADIGSRFSGSGGSAADLVDLRLRLVLDGGDGWRTVLLGSPSRSVLTAAIPCTSGCRVVALRIDDANPVGPWEASFTVQRLETDTQSDGDLADALVADRWRQDIDANSGRSDVPRVRLTTVDSRLRIAVQDGEPSVTVGIAPRDGLQPLPVLVGPRTEVRAVNEVAGASYGLGSDLETVYVRPIGRAAALPRALAIGQLADLEALDRVSDPGGTASVQQVWLSPAATASTVRALRANGLRIIGEQRLATAVDAAQRGVVPVVVRQGAAIGIAGLFLALAALPAVELLRRRALAARVEAWTDAAGRPRTAMLLTFLGSVLPPAVGVLLGIAAGAAAVTTIIRLLPLSPGSPVDLPVDLGIAGVAVLLPVLVAVVVLPVLGAVNTVLGSRR